MGFMPPLRFFRKTPTDHPADLELLRRHLTLAGQLDASAPLQLSPAEQEHLTRAGLLRGDDTLAWPSPRAAQQLGLRPQTRALSLRRSGEAELLVRWTSQADDPRPTDLISGWRWKGAGLGVRGTLREQLDTPARHWKDGAEQAAKMRGGSPEQAWADVRALHADVSAAFTPEWLRQELLRSLAMGARPQQPQGRA